jgi:hypothetical protein
MDPFLQFIMRAMSPMGGAPRPMGGMQPPPHGDPLEAPYPGGPGGEAPYPGMYGSHNGPGRGGRFLRPPQGGPPGFPPHGDPTGARLPPPPHPDPGDGMGGQQGSRFDRRMAYRADQMFMDQNPHREVDNGSGGYQSNPAFRPGFNPQRFYKTNNFLGHNGRVAGLNGPPGQWGGMGGQRRFNRFG